MTYPDPLGSIIHFSPTHHWLVRGGPSPSGQAAPSHCGQDPRQKGVRSIEVLSRMITVAVITRGRPVQLDALLGRLAELYGGDPTIQLAVVDNDEEASARGVVDRHRAGFVGGLRYEVEVDVGYSTARNRAVSLLGDDDYLAFIDDDELPEPGWLEALLRTSRDFSADVVAGLVVSELPPDAPAAIMNSGVMDAQLGKQQRSGEVMEWCATNNTLIHRSVFDRVAGGFDPRFNHVGGEDSHFFLRATQAGCRIVWCPDAVVREPAAPARLQPGWHLDRARHVGRVWTTLDLELRRTPRVLLRRGARLAYAIGKGMALLTSGGIRGDSAARLRGRYELSLARGMAEAVVPARRWQLFEADRCRG